MLSVLPLHHCFEFSAGFLLPLYGGATTTYLPETTAEAIAMGRDPALHPALAGLAVAALPRQAADRRQEQTLREQLPREPESSRSEARAERHLLLSRE